jgi:competence protein ComEA
VVVVLLVAVVVGAWVMMSRPKSVAFDTQSATVPIASRSAASTWATTADTATTAPAPAIVVDVAGKVRRPGVYPLPAGSRVYDAVRAAGGALAGVDLSTLNLAAVLADGQQVAVGVAPAVGGPSGSTGQSSGAAGSAGPVHLNS